MHVSHVAQAGVHAGDVGGGKLVFPHQVGECI
jgi:hypothetical protein